MKTCVIWKNTGEGIKELCLKTEGGAYVGVETGITYLQSKHYESALFYATKCRVLEEDQTGMIHLDKDSSSLLKKKNFIGCRATFRKAHLYGKEQVYHCIETCEYWSGSELKDITPANF